MTILNSHFDTEIFFDKLARAETRVLMLDYDGTLAPFRIDRNQALPYDGVREVLNAILEGRHSRLVFITGRRPQDLVRLLDLDRRPEIWGSHGWEHLTADGKLEMAPLDHRAVRGLAQAYAWIEKTGWQERCERKPASLAVHWRGMDEEKVDKIHHEISRGWQNLAGESGLDVYPFDGGVELRARGRNKGSAVETILADVGNSAVAAFLGDDQTDEDGFQAIKGRGLGILVREEYRPTAADLHIRPPGELLDFLWRWDEACRG